MRESHSANRHYVGVNDHLLVTATVANPSIPLTLPKTTAEIIDPPPKAITISINANGEVAWILK